MIFSPCLKKKSWRYQDIINPSNRLWLRLWQIFFVLETWNCNTYFGSLGNGGVEVVFCFRFFTLNYLNIGWMTTKWCTRWISSFHEAHQIGYLNRQAGPRSRIKSAGSRLKLSFPFGVLKKRVRPDPGPIRSDRPKAENERTVIQRRGNKNEGIQRHTYTLGG